MSTHNICFRGEIRKILCGYSLLSVAMMWSVKMDQTVDAQADLSLQQVHMSEGTFS